MYVQEYVYAGLQWEMSFIVWIKLQKVAKYCCRQLSKEVEGVIGVCN